jgi:low affinity Fe/Cu permease
MSPSRKVADNWQIILVTSIAALVPSVIGWLNNQAKIEKIEEKTAQIVVAESQTGQTSESYRRFILDRLERDAALQKALLQCLEDLHEEDESLDEIAKDFGYEAPGTENP